MNNIANISGNISQLLNFTTTLKVSEIVIFYTIGVFTLLVIATIYIAFQNKRTKPILKKFKKQSNDLKPMVLENVKLNYEDYRNKAASNSYGDLYMFEEFLVILRRQRFIFKIIYLPILITSNVIKAKNVFDYLQVYKLVGVNFNHIVKGQIEIKLLDSTKSAENVDLVFKRLTEEQMKEIAKIKNWL